MSMVIHGSLLAQSSHRPITAAEAARAPTLYTEIGLLSEDHHRRILPDEIADTIAQRARLWVTKPAREFITGIQLDPMGTLSVIAGRDADARRYFDARLATPGLSVADRAYTLLMAVSTFGHAANDTTRMRTAFHYLMQLDALPSTEALTQFVAHGRLARTYYMMGDGAAVVRHVMHAFALVPRIPFERRVWGQVEGIGEYFPLLADVLSGMPNGRAQLDSVGTWLLPYTRMNDQRIASDSQVVRQSRANENMFRDILHLTSHLGRKAPSITAQYWWNISAPATASPDDSRARVKELADGKIHVLEYGHVGCSGCVAAIPKMQQLSRTVPQNVELMYVTFGHGIWGVTPCSPDEEAQHLKHYYTVRKGVTFPIALWIGSRQDDPDGGSEQTSSPSFLAYPITGFPWFVVTDGRGIVRHLSMGFSPDVLTRAIAYLVAEAQRS